MRRDEADRSDVRPCRRSDKDQATTAPSVRRNVVTREAGRQLVQKHPDVHRRKTRQIQAAWEATRSDRASLVECEFQVRNSAKAGDDLSAVVQERMNRLDYGTSHHCREQRDLPDEGLAETTSATGQAKSQAKTN